MTWTSVSNSLDVSYSGSFLYFRPPDNPITVGIFMTPRGAIAFLLCICGWKAWSDLGAIGGWKDSPRWYGYRIITDGSTLKITLWNTERCQYSYEEVDMKKLGLVLLAMLLEIDQ